MTTSTSTSVLTKFMGPTIGARSKGRQAPPAGYLRMACATFAAAGRYIGAHCAASNTMNRATTIFIALAALVSVSLLVAVVLVVDDTVARELVGVVLVGELVLILAALALVWSWLQLRLLRPLRRVADDVHLVAHGNATHECVDTHDLGALPANVNELAQRYARARHDTAKAMATASARVQRSQLRLEAIMSDLSEAVVVCTTQHRVVLFDHAATAMLGVELGLHRTITKVIDQQSLRDALAELYRQLELTDAPGRVMFECGFGAGKRAVAHVHLLHEADGAARGYVLCLGGRGAPAPMAPQAARPFYYDFDLFDTDASPALRELPLAQLDCVVFDTETTGLEPSAGDQIVQLAGVRVVNGTVLRAEVFDRLANPAMAMPPVSTRIHGITDAMVSDAAPVADVVREFHLWTDRQVLVAHNAAFDMRFLQLQHESSGVNFDQPVLDSLLLSVLLSAQEQNHTLDALMRRLGVQMDPALRHTALGDAVATADVFAAMLAPLAARGIRTVGQALDESAKLFAIRREQQKF